MTSFFMIKYIIIFFLFLNNINICESTTQIITLNKNNFISIDAEISDSNVVKWTNQLSKLNSNPMYLYIDSSGGSVIAGLQFMNMMNWYMSQGNKINCIGKSAYSMAFIIFQNCSNRYVISSTTLMQHQMILSEINGQINNIQNYFEMINQISYQLDNMVSLRLNMSLVDYRNKISNDWWIYGNYAIDYKVADEFVIVGCDFELYEIAPKKEFISIKKIEFISDKNKICPL